MMKRLLAAFGSTALVLMALILGAGPALAGSDGLSYKPPQNPYLASPLYAITHFDSSQSDSTPYGPPRGAFMVDPGAQPVCYGGMVNIITLASTNPDYMWQVGTDRVSYVKKSNGKWITQTKYPAMAKASNQTLPPIPDANLQEFGQSTAVGMDPTSMDNYMKSLFSDNYGYRFGNGSYVLVDKDNVLYVPYLTTLYAFTLKDPANPSSGIGVRYKLQDVINAIQGSNPAPPAGTRIVGLAMTYDGHIVLTFSNGVAVIDRNLNIASKVFYRFADNEQVSNSIAVDSDNCIYVASNLVMRKLVWTGTTISDKASDGAWSSPYDNSGNELPPIIKFGNGTGSTPTLMGFGKDADKLVVITDGAKQMKLVAFWRHKVPAGSQRIADQIQVTCGFDSPLPEWIQSEQSVVVYGYGAFVVNNIPQTVAPEVKAANKYVQVALMGPAYPTSFGAERFEWNPTTHKWASVWGRSDVSSTSMVPIHSTAGNMAVINGYRFPYGWEVLGLDWNTGDTVHHTIFGDKNFGNGAYAILQYLKNGDLLFNSIAGPLRVNYGQ
ncbi:MAG: hypothetical protein ACLGPL_03830 [Acidobacteriota bacterium]